MHKEDIQKELISFFTQRGKFSENEAEQYIHENYIDKGLLDSIEFITLISEVEENYNISFTQEQIQADSFRQISGMSGMISEMLSN